MSPVVIIPYVSMDVNTLVCNLNEVVIDYGGIMFTEMSDFTDWLNGELNERGWGYNELARRAGVSGGSISHIMNLRKNPGYDVCMGIAKAFEMQPEDVLRRAELLPPLPAAVEEEREAVRILRQLPPKAQTYIERVSTFVRGLSFTQLVSAIYKAYPEMRANSVFQE